MSSHKASVNSGSITLTTDQTTSGENEPTARTLPGTNERFLSQFLRLIILFNTSPQRTISRRKRFVASFVSTVALIAIAATSTTAIARAPYLQVEQPIRDSAGRILVIVDFVSTAHETYPGVTPKVPPLALKVGQYFPRPQVSNLVADYERKYSFVRRSMTSWAGSSVSAYLDGKQIEDLINDPLVQQVSQDRLSELSAPMPWYDFNSGIESYSWGRYAVNGKIAPANSTRKIYVIDSGVAYHTDLPNSQVTRTNVECSPSGGCEYVIPPNWTTTPNPVVGCYGHATHVAGILAAPVNNTGGSGVYAGANITSLNVTNVLNGARSEELCTSPKTLTQTAVGNALDYVMQETLYGTQMAVVNLSINSAGMGIASSGIPEPNWSKARNVAFPTYRYDVGRQYYGAFIAQSAGNGARPVLDANGNPVYPTVGSDACYWNASGAPSGYKPLVSAPYSVDDDGIMVVGAINQYAGPANPFTPASPAVAETDPPTSYGRCVDIRAPGDAIWSTWGANPSTAYSNGTYSNMVRLSGTSMASPHVAAAAAYIADVEELTTPAAVEQRIRQLGVQFGGTVDQGGFPIKVLQLP